MAVLQHLLSDLAVELGRGVAEVALNIDEFLQFVKLPIHFQNRHLQQCMQALVSIPWWWGIGCCCCANVTMLSPSHCQTNPGRQLAEGRCCSGAPSAGPSPYEVALRSSRDASVRSPAPKVLHSQQTPAQLTPESLPWRVPCQDLQLHASQCPHACPLQLLRPNLAAQAKATRCSQRLQAPAAH